MTELYAVPADGGATTRVLATPARYVSWEPDGASFLYQDVKGFEDEWRKHHTSGVTRDIWRYDTRSGQHTNLTERRGEDTNPAAGAAWSFLLSGSRMSNPWARWRRKASVALLAGVLWISRPSISLRLRSSRVDFRPGICRFRASLNR